MNRFDGIRAELLQKPSTWLVTGVAGFIGSNLLEALLELDQYVVGLDNFFTGYERNIDDVRHRVGAKGDRFEFIQGDIRNPEDCRRACSGVDYILHQAALGSVPRSIDDPVTTNTCNVDGFLNMLVAAMGARVKRFVFASSSSVYGDSEKLPKTEDEIGAALSPYAASKLVNEIYAGVFSRVYDFSWIGLRYFNVFGKRQDPKGAYAAVIPCWIDTLLRAESPVINGDGETSRDFCYIKDVIQGNILAAMCDSPEALGKVYNIACGHRTTLNELMAIIKGSLRCRGLGVDGTEPVYGPFRKGDVRHSLADISRAKDLLGFEPAYSVGAGMEESIEWYVKNAKA
ncbi:MAG: SDR family oxidoreductase [Deltaproteobacteria bacterium]|jgi:UDP-N-acetylglucosamine 4-epimerase|nr:SDR family oxidoreductase [Deltaproteobacteria bacterium]